MPGGACSMPPHTACGAACSCHAVHVARLHAHFELGRLRPVATGYGRRIAEGAAITPLFRAPSGARGAVADCQSLVFAGKPPLP
eukprot:12298517-Alexandrium_andersonii.AAC.1